MALIGVSLSALSAAVATGILAKAGTISAEPLNFIGGSLSNVAWSDIRPAAPFFGAGLALALPVAGNMSLLGLGDRVAANLGARPTLTRALAFTSAGVLGGTAVTLAGLVGFAGLLVPHFARLLVGHDFRVSVALALPLGAALVLAADQVARLAFMPSEVPVGLVMAILGAPVMIFVARRVM